MIDTAIMVVSPASGPETINGDLLKNPTKIPLTVIRETIPEYKGAPKAKEISKQRGIMIL